MLRHSNKYDKFRLIQKNFSQDPDYLHMPCQTFMLDQAHSTIYYHDFLFFLNKNIFNFAHTVFYKKNNILLVL